MPKATISSKNFRVIAGASFLTGSSYNLIAAVWQPFVLSLGVPMSTLGLLEGVAGRRGALAAVLQPLTGWLSDCLGRKPLIVLGSLVSLLAFACYTLAGSGFQWWLLGLGIMLLAVGLASKPAETSLVAESVSATERGTAYSITRVCWILPGMVAPALGGLVADHFGFSLVFLLCIVLQAVHAVLVLGLLSEGRAAPRRALSRGELLRVLSRMITPPRELRGQFWAVAADGFAWSLAGFILPGLLTQTYRFTTFQLGLMSSLLSLVSILSLPLFGRLVDRFGCRPFLLLSEVLGIVVVAGRLCSRSFFAFALFDACYGLSLGSWVPAQQALLANSVSGEELGEVTGRLAAFRGVIALPASYIGGLLYDHFGFGVPMVGNLLGLLLPLGAIALGVKEPSRKLR